MKIDAYSYQCYALRGPWGGGNGHGERRGGRRRPYGRVFRNFFVVADAGAAAGDGDGACGAGRGVISLAARTRSARRRRRQHLFVSSPVHSTSLELPSLAQASTPVWRAGFPEGAARGGGTRRKEGIRRVLTPQCAEAVGAVERWTRRAQNETHGAAGSAENAKARDLCEGRRV
ncbi:hypothetical protein HYPSUDRAFT_204942 [Hypholoma sublateritium FD-334 SS-4]|uniref:Uncharacterized protein n=1 Tax=Hypholoma sublateritium (strain FD-334 SS-4) TaxID=945553 RepID=A0A0D2KWM4_HYPSF|nr:hypothetical protein HYPSUDRAFT_204942 [Hypholoma sublateritium FD-334 SS-4]